MDKVVIFAHFDINCVIKDYVIYYLKELKQIAKKIIFVSDCNLPKHELDKLEGTVFHSIAYQHGEYDFGSYKRGYLYAKNNNLLNNCEELIFVNDSCYGPLYSFHDIWAECDSWGDFWGINTNEKDVPYHIQSFFLVFKRKVFNSEIFDSFMINIKKEATKNDIIQKYEIGLSQLLINNGYIPYALFKDQISANLIDDTFIFQVKINPLIKISVFKNNTLILSNLTCKYIFHKFKINYPIENIITNLNVNKNTISMIFQDLKSIRKCLIKIHFKEKNLYLFGKLVNKKNETLDILEEFKGLIPLNIDK